MNGRLRDADEPTIHRMGGTSPEVAGRAASPVASPLGLATGAAYAPVRGASGGSWSPNDPSTEVPGSRPRRGQPARSNVGARQLARLEEGLAERDLAVLRRVGEHGFLTREQITRFVFTRHASEQTAERTSRRVLTRLDRDGLLRSLPRRQGGMHGGSTPAVWQLTSAGARLLRGAAGRSHRVSVPSVRWLNHCLAVAETHLAIRGHGDASDRGVEVTVEQAGWRIRTGLGGEAVWLKPDLFAHITGRDDEGEYHDYWFVEVDLGTESLPTLLRKASRYQAHYQSGVEQDQLGTFPLVLWVFAGSRDEERRIEFADRLKASRTLDGRLHRTAALAGVADVLASPSTTTGGQV
ncbi:MAG: replication-relaxation family protein [Rhodoglobus sp.]